MDKKDKFEKVFNYSIGCFGLLGVLATIITLFVTLKSPSVVIQFIEGIADLPTSTPFIIQVTSDIPSPTLQVIELPTPYPTYTPYPTFTPVVVPSTTKTPPPTVSLPFEDSFDTRSRPEWEVITGTWRVLDGHFTGGDDGWQIVFVGDASWHNYEVEVTTFSRSFITGVRIIIRASDEGYIAFQYGVAGGKWLLIKNGQTKELATVDRRFSWDTTYRIKIRVEDDIYTLFIDGTQYSQIQDTTFTNGKVGLGYSPRYLNWFDDFRVSELP